jgi:hypothetical protein
MSKGTEGAKKEGGAAPEAAAKKESAPSSKAKGPTAVAGGCHSWGCKHSATRFNFCDEHYDHFKFGLIKKTGEPVPDYEKKLGHYLAHKGKQGAHKVA